LIVKYFMLSRFFVKYFTGNKYRKTFSKNKYRKTWKYFSVKYFTQNKQALSSINLYANTTLWGTNIFLKNKNWGLKKFFGIIIKPKNIIGLKIFPLRYIFFNNMSLVNKKIIL
jgi:hypothetical protein